MTHAVADLVVHVGSIKVSVLSDDVDADGPVGGNDDFERIFSW